MTKTIRTCSCGKQYSLEQWLKLPHNPRLCDSKGNEYRHCNCETTLFMGRGMLDELKKLKKAA